MTLSKSDFVMVVVPSRLSQIQREEGGAHKAVAIDCPSSFVEQLLSEMLCLL